MSNFNNGQKVAALYARVSTNKKEQAESLENQGALLKKICEEKGWTPYSVVYEDAKTGTSTNRKALNSLISDAKSRKFDILVTKEISRLARNQRYALELRDTFQANGIDIYSIKGEINTLENDTENFGLHAWIAEREASSASSRIKAVFRTKQLNGEFLGAHAPYGYRVEKKKLFVREDDSPNVVRMIFKLFIDGNGFDKIARNLLEANVSTPSQVHRKSNQSKLWHGSTVRKILENNHYIGDLVQHRETTISITNKKRKQIPKEENIVVKDTHEAIVSREDFALVQDLIAKRRRPAINNPDAPSRPHQIVNKFTEVLVCAECGRNFHFKKNRIAEYICGGYNKHGRTVCSPKPVSEKFLANTIRADLKEFVKFVDSDIFVDKLQLEAQKSQNTLRNNIKAMEAKLKAIEVKHTKAIEKYVDGDLDKPSYELFASNIEHEKQKIKSDIKLSDEELVKSVQGEIHILGKVKSFVDEALTFNDLTRNTINRFIDKIVVNDENSFDIHYKFASINSFANNNNSIN